MSLSALLELVKVKSFDDAIKITAKNIDDHHGNLPKHKFRCSVLGRQTFADAVVKYRAQKIK